LDSHRVDISPPPTMASRRLPPLPTIKDILRIYNIKAQKRLSQNFILDPRLLDKVARAGGSLAGCHVVEVGPGPGGITRSILGQDAAQCTVIEKDLRFLPSLRLLGEASGGRLVIHTGDVLSFNMCRLFPDVLRKGWNEEIPNVRVLGNLPFNVSTPLIIRWLADISTRGNIFSYGRVPLTLTFQKEVVDRMVAPPGASCRSRLSVMCQNWADVQHRFTIPGRAFVPKPEVDVGVVYFTPLKQPYIDLPFPMVEKVVTTIFHGKQKHLKNTVGQLFPKPMAKHFSEQMMAEAGLNDRRRAIDLNMADFSSLCHSYQRIVDENPSLGKYRHQSAKVQALGPLVYEDGEIFVDELNPSSSMPLVDSSHPLEAPKCDLV